MSTTCEKDDPDEPSGCEGIAAASATGYITQSFCFDALVTYEYELNGNCQFTARQSGDPEYAYSFRIYEFTGNGTYNCGPDQDAFSELILHGADNEFYKAQSGTVTITEYSLSGMKATFNLVTKGYYNDEIVNISGVVDFQGVQ